jgi:hypothetical protein
MKRLLGWLFLACLAAACGDPDSGPPLGDFPAISKTTADAPFTLTAPSSRSPAAFTFTSSNLAVATIEGATVTIKGVGTSTITASQDRIGSFGPTSKATTLTVAESTCPSGQTLVNGTCQATRDCIAPATLQGNDCKASLLPTAVLNNAIWAAVTVTDTFADARDFCSNTVINDVPGGRQPTVDELTSLVSSGVIPRSGWTLGATWSSTAGSRASNHAVVDLRDGTRSDRADTDNAGVSCMRPN